MLISWPVCCRWGWGCRGEPCGKGPPRRSEAWPSTADRGWSRWPWQWGWRRHLMLSGQWNPVGKRGKINHQHILVDHQRRGCRVAMNEDESGVALGRGGVYKKPAGLKISLMMSAVTLHSSLWGVSRWMNEWILPCTVCWAGHWAPTAYSW